jgi:hypothetical protein
MSALPVLLSTRMGGQKLRLIPMRPLRDGSQQGAGVLEQQHHVQRVSRRRLEVVPGVEVRGSLVEGMSPPRPHAKRRCPSSPAGSSSEGASCHAQKGRAADNGLRAAAHFQTPGIRTSSRHCPVSS